MLLNDVLWVATIIILLYTLWLLWRYRMKQEEFNKTIYELKNALEYMASAIQSEKDAVSRIEGRLDMLQSIDSRLSESVRQVSALEKGVSTLSPQVKTLYDSIVGSRGAAGEKLLSWLLERVLLPGEYETQVPLGNYRVDVLLKLDMGDGTVKIPVDSKFTGGKVADVKSRIDEVAKYVPYSDTNFALMYVPSDSIYLDIASKDDVMMYAFSKNVYIVGPTGLYSFIKSSHMLKSLSRLSQKQKEIMEKMSEMKKEIDDIVDAGSKYLKHSQNMTGRLKDLLDKLKYMRERWL